MAEEIKEQAGVNAIIALQAMVGIVETEEQAKRGWTSMSAHEKESTLEIYEKLCKQ
jgi:hypothetical protein